jgi:MerR family redox-sensitive transcriptional activator SoxR
LRSSFDWRVRIALTALLTIGELARRTGLSVSAIRYYESRGLVNAVRTAGNQRRFMRSDIRRLSFVLIAQQMGLSVANIEAELRSLPQGRTPSRQDWEVISSRIKATIDAKIRVLERIREKLAGCIGCGCLSLDKCALYNADDRAGLLGSGPRFVVPLS